MAEPRAYLVGGGIAALAAAVFLIRDGGFAGRDVLVLEQLPVVGGSMDGAGDAVTGYVSRGGRMLSDEACNCLWNLLASIPTLTDPTVTVRDEIRLFNQSLPTVATARIVDEQHRIVDAAALGLNGRDRAELAWLLMLPEHAIGSRAIEDFFSPHFFGTNF